LEGFEQMAAVVAALA
jgi:hypothetical protein